MTLLVGFLGPRRRVIARTGAGMRDTGSLNAASPLGDALLWAVVSGVHPWRDRKGGTDGQAEGGAGTVINDSGFLALRSPGWSGAGWYWPAPAVAGKEWTWQARLSLDPPDENYEQGDLPKLLTIPYHTADWKFPFGFDLFMLSMTEGQTTSQMRVGYAVNSSARRICTSPTAFILLDGAEHTYAVRVRDQGTNGEVDWWRDGAAIGTSSFNGAHGEPDLGAAPYLIALNRHRQALDEGEVLRATMPAAGLWGKALSDAQIALFHSNPWDLAEVSTDPLVPATLHAWDDYVTLVAGDTSAVSVLANDSGTGRFVDSVTQPAGVEAGTSAAIVGGGAGIEVTVDEDQTGDFSFTYTAKAPGDQESTATVHVAVFVPPPLGVDDAYTLAPGQTHTVSPLLNDNAPAGSAIQSVTQPSGVQPGTSVAITGNQTQLNITIAANETGQFSFTYTGTGPRVSPWTQTATVTVQQEVVAPANNERPYLGRFYGCISALGWGSGDTLLRRTGDDAIGVYFVAPRTGMIAKWWQNVRKDDAPGTTTQSMSNIQGGDGSIVSGNFVVCSNPQHYSRGDGGRYDIYVFPANPNTKLKIPGSQPIGKRTDWRPTQIMRRAGFDSQDLNWGFCWFLHPLLDFDQPFPVEANGSYVFEWHNVHPNPTGNYVAMNISPHLIADDPWDPTPFVGHSGSGWTPAAAGGGIGGKDWFPWPVVYEFQEHRTIRYGPPYLGFEYTDGIRRGHWVFIGGQRDSSSGTIWWEWSGNSQIRERFRVTETGAGPGDLVVDGFWIWGARKGSQSGNLVVTLEQGPSSDTSGNGTVLREASIPLNSLTNVGSSYNRNVRGTSTVPDRPQWCFLPFTQITLSKGTIYNMRLRVSGSGAFWLGANMGMEHNLCGKSPIASSWTEHDQITRRSLECWRDSRGTMETSNGGSSWNWITPLLRRTTPTALRRVL